MDNSKEAFDLLSAVMVVVNFIPLVLFFAVLLIGFIIVTKKCFFEKYTFSRIVVPLLLSPTLPCIISRVITIPYVYDYDIDQIIFGFIMYTAIIIVASALQLLLYVMFVKPKNRSFAIFIYLCCFAFSTFNDFVESFLTYGTGSDLVMWIITLAIITEAIVFYKLVICPLAELSRTKQERGLAVFVVIPAVSVAVKLAIMVLRGLYEQFLINDLNYFKPLVGSEVTRTEENTAAFRELYYAYYAANGSYYVASHAIMILLIIAFAVIVRNVTHINEINRQKNEIQEARDNIKELSVEVMEALAHTIDAKDRYTNGHSMRVAKYSRMIAEKMGLPPQQCENVYYMGLLHDIGKIGVPNEIINKPSRLTDSEYDIIRTHPTIGYNILSEIKSRPDLANGARWHHERYDGRGYPDRISGGDIPIESRIIAVADSYDAMTSNRSYRSYLPQEKVRAEIEANIGSQFDPEAAKYMIAIMDEDKDYVLHE